MEQSPTSDSRTMNKEGLRNQNEAAHDTTEMDPSNNTTAGTKSAEGPTGVLLPPPAGGSYPNRAAAEIFLKNFANNNHYGLSSIDSKPRLMKWKCIRGPNQKQILAAAEDPTITIPTCPFQVSAKYVASDTTWTIIVIHDEHDHGPIPNLKAPKLPSLTSKHPRKQKQRSDTIVLDLTRGSDDDDTDHKDAEPLNDYEILIKELKKLDSHSRQTLMQRFLRDCQIANEVSDTRDPVEPKKDKVQTKKDKVEVKKAKSKKVKTSTKSPTEQEVEDKSEVEDESKGKGREDTPENIIEPQDPKTVTGKEDHAVEAIQEEETEVSTSKKVHNDEEQQPDVPDSPLTSQGDPPSPVTTRKRQVARVEKANHAAKKSESAHGPKTRKSVRVNSVSLDKDQPANKRVKRSEPFSLQNITSAAKEHSEKQKKTKEERLVNATPEERVLIKWSFVKTLPVILRPFVKSATNVKGNGLCAFASVAVSLGRPESDAVKVRAVMATEVRKNYEWYEDALPKLSEGGTDISHMLEILESPLNYAPRRLWYPMPGACCIIANTFKKTVISYSANTVSSCTIPPFLSAPHGNTRPIILGVIQGTHCISLELEFSANLPIPHIHPDWRNLRSPKAKDWGTFFCENIKVWREWRKESNSITGPNCEKKVISDDDDTSSKEK